MLPILTGTMPVTTGLRTAIIPEEHTSVLMQKQNTVALESIPFNQIIDFDAKTSEEIKKSKAEAIDSYFRKYDMPLEGTGMKMVEEAEKYDLDWRLLPAIAVRESTGGKFACKKATFNPFGWGSCKINFKSNEHAIETVARNLAGENPNTAKHYAGKDTEGILLAYNPPHIVPKYVPQVMKIMENMGEKDLVIIPNIFRNEVAIKNPA